MTLGTQIRTYSGDIYKVPIGQEHEIEVYRSAVEAIERNRQRPVPLSEYEPALETMIKYETGETGWQFID